MQKNSTAKLLLAALGVVFGDIGTSPLYTFRQCLKAANGATQPEVFGIVSLIFWSVTLVVTVKYVFFVMRADNEREGGILALMALVGKSGPPPLRRALTLMGLFGAAMFYGDSMITPAISVLGAVEGLEVINSNFERLVVPVALVILIALFAVQKRGTAAIGAYFGPVMLLWFGVLAWLGAVQVVHHPDVLAALLPIYAANFVAVEPTLAFVVLASVFLAITGGEALYADMGHFGKAPIQRAWLWLVFPALMLNYLGQGALVLHDAAAVKSPFFALAPSWALVPLVVLATAATVIASQAVISGAYSMTKQAIQLGYAPRFNVVHTSSTEIGQVYLPSVNAVLLIAVVFLVLFFRSSDNLASAYGIAVASTMMLTTVFMFVVTRYVWQWSLIKSLTVTGLMLLIDLLFVSANLSKVLDGGWFPLLVGAAIFTLMTTWYGGRQLVFARLTQDNLPLDAFITTLFASESRPLRVDGTAVFLSSLYGVTPSSFLHNLKHNHVVHETNIFLTLQTQQIPYVRNADKVEVRALGHQCYQVTARIGFKQLPDVPHLMELLQERIRHWRFEPMASSFFLSRDTVLASQSVKGMALWRERIFVVMVRNAAKAADYFCLPANRVIELGANVQI